VSGCSKTPDCGSSDTLSILSDIYNKNSIFDNAIIKDDEQKNGSSHYMKDQNIENKIKNLSIEKSNAYNQYSTAHQKFEDDIYNDNRDPSIYEKYWNHFLSIQNEMDSISREYESRQNEFFQKNWNKSKSNIIYKLENTVMTFIDKSTGRVECKSKIVGEVPGWGSANQDIRYSVERTTDGNLYVTLNQ
jgi:hypothetical protein